MTKNKHIVLTSHPPKGSLRPHKITWGATTPHGRGPVIGSLNNSQDRNVIGTHSGGYGVYRALAIAAGTLDPVHKPDLTNTMPTTKIGPFSQWADPEKIISLDPYGHVVAGAFTEFLDQGLDIRPTIAITQARIHLPELREAIAADRIRPDGKILMDGGEANVTKAAIEPVWHLPGIAKRLKIHEAVLRRSLFEYTGGIVVGIVAIVIEENDHTTAYRKTYKCVSAILTSTEWQRQANAQHLDSFKSYKPEMAFPCNNQKGIS